MLGGGGGGGGDEEGDRQTTGSEGTLTGSELDSQDSNPITSKSIRSQKEPYMAVGDNNKMAITVESFTLETGSSMASNHGVKNIFIEYEFLDFDRGELETSSALKPVESDYAVFNFRKGNAFRLECDKVLQVFVECILKQN